VERGQDFLIAAHQAGNDRHPNWYLNLVSNPNVTVELFWKRQPYRAEPIKDQAENQELLEQFPFGIAEAFQEYMTRSIRIIRLRPTMVAD